MTKPSTPPKRHRHYEIVTRLYKIIALLNKQTRASLVEEAVAAEAKEYYTNADLLTILRVTKRTLACYRQLNLIPYYMIRGKVYYKVSDVQEYLRKKEKSTPEPE